MSWYDGLTEEEKLCYVLDTYPSKLPEFYWSRSNQDLKLLVNLKLGREASGYIQDYENLIKVVSQALGADTTGSKSTKKYNQPKNEVELTAAFNSIFG